MLSEKMRPRSWDEVVGNESTVAALCDTEPGEGRVYLLHGPSGCGKTTMARLLAKDLGCSDSDIEQYSWNAATPNQDNLLNSIDLLSGGESFMITKAIVIEEADNLPERKQALLLDVLDKKRIASIIFCTTKPHKIIESIKTRAFNIKVSSLTADEMGQLLHSVSDREQLTPPEHLLNKIIERANGSPRTALNLLDTISTMPIEQAEIAVEDVISCQEEAIKRFEELGTIIGKSEKQRFHLMMKWRLWEVELVTPIEFFNKHFCRCENTFWRWKKKFGYIDDTRSKAISEGMRKGKDKQDISDSNFENQSSTEQNEFDGFEDDDDCEDSEFNLISLIQQLEDIKPNIEKGVNYFNTHAGQPTFTADEILLLRKRIHDIIPGIDDLLTCLDVAKPAEDAA